MAKLTWVVGHCSKRPHKVGHGLRSEFWQYLLSSVGSCLQLQRIHTSRFLHAHLTLMLSFGDTEH